MSVVMRQLLTNYNRQDKILVGRLLDLAPSGSAIVNLTVDNSANPNMFLTTAFAGIVRDSHMMARLFA